MVAFGELQFLRLDEQGAASTSAEGEQEFAEDAVDALLQVASFAFIRAIDAEFLLTIKGFDDVRPFLDVPTPTLDPAGEYSPDSGVLELDTVLSLFSLTPCSRSIVAVGPLPSARRRALSRNVFVRYSLSLPVAVARNVSCLLFSSGNDGAGDVLDLLRVNHLSLIKDETQATHSAVRDVNGTCLCGCLDDGDGKGPTASTSGESLPWWLLAMMVLASMCLVLVAAVALCRKQLQRKRAGLWHPVPPGLPAYVEPPSYSKFAFRGLAAVPFVKREAPAYRPPPAWSPRLSQGAPSPSMAGLPTYEQPPAYADLGSYASIEDPFDDVGVWRESWDSFSVSSGTESGSEGDSLARDLREDWMSEDDSMDGPVEYGYLLAPRKLEPYVPAPNIFSEGPDAPPYEDAPPFPFPF